MESRERVFISASAILFVAVALAIALAVPENRDLNWPVLLGLVAGYALVSRVRFEFAIEYVSAEQLAFVPMLLLLPVGYVPLAMAAASLLAVLPDVTSGVWDRRRWILAVGESWFVVGPVLVVALLAPGAPSLDNVHIYALAFLAEVAGDSAWWWLRYQMLDPIPFKEFFRISLATIEVDAFLSPLAFLVAVVAYDDPLALLAIAPLVWLLRVFSRERTERYSATLELNRAYKGTVMLLVDVVEHEDGYTAHHSRSVVDLVQAVAEEINIDPNRRQELEFAALLHDVGKISIPKEILNKPAALTADEYELMKTHPIEGQFILDRVGGLLGRAGEIVRSCHERWDGTGYPDGLAGDEIPLEARIVFTCDAYNAMTTDRPYRAALATEEALAELIAHAGTQFDPDIVAALVKVVEQGQPEPSTGDEMRALLARLSLPQGASAAS